MVNDKDGGMASVGAVVCDGSMDNGYGVVGSEVIVERANGGCVCSGEEDR